MACPWRYWYYHIKAFGRNSLTGFVIPSPPIDIGFGLVIIWLHAAHRQPGIKLTDVSPSNNCFSKVCPFAANSTRRHACYSFALIIIISLVFYSKCNPCLIPLSAKSLRKTLYVSEVAFMAVLKKSIPQYIAIFIFIISVSISSSKNRYFGGKKSCFKQAVNYNLLCTVEVQENI